MSRAVSGRGGARLAAGLGVVAALCFAGRPAEPFSAAPGPSRGVERQAPSGASPSASPAPAQTDADHYTRYELLAPESASFRILYEVTATTPGATHYFNPIRKGSEASDEAVYDRLTGRALTFDVVGAAEAASGGVAGDADQKYIRVRLARPVPKGGEARLLIEKTYKDAKSYFREGDLIVFSRSLGIKRNAVVLPAGYELVSCNVPSQVRQEKDGRLAASFVNSLPDAASLVLKARRLR